jgi:hypothetical protein
MITMLLETQDHLRVCDEACDGQEPVAKFDKKSLMSSYLFFSPPRIARQ